MGCSGICRCDILQDGKIKIAVFTELNENKGPSVTNAIECIVATYCETVLNGPLGDNLVIIERYENRPNDLDIVRFKQIRMENGQWIFEDPVWQRLKGELALRVTTVLGD